VFLGNIVAHDRDCEFLHIDAKFLCFVDMATFLSCKSNALSTLCRSVLVRGYINILFVANICYWNLGYECSENAAHGDGECGKHYIKKKRWGKKNPNTTHHHYIFSLQLMAIENVAQGHVTVDEEEVAIAMNWQSSNSNNNGSDNSGSYESPKDELRYLLLKRGLEKVQMNETLIIFLRKRYGSVVVRSQF
jgi:hypothetical protein